MVGLLWPELSKLGLGRLPGDIRIETQSGVFYIPITTGTSDGAISPAQFP
jgi:hypothetical protein